MPKDRRVCSLSFDRSRASPYPCSSKNAEQYKSKSTMGSVEDVKEWEEARCPICMEHPHNAVLLQCSSNEKGCRLYMCNTSYHHSNCLIQFCKSFGQSKLVCPFCRGHIYGQVVIEPARRFMNSKQRSCSCETCDFSGTYSELRKHARSEHPSVRPSEVDPTHQCKWRRFERRREFEDIRSLVQPVFGNESSEDSSLSVEFDHWTPFFFPDIFSLEDLLRA